MLFDYAIIKACLKVYFHESTKTISRFYCYLSEQLVIIVLCAEENYCFYFHASETKVERGIDFSLVLFPQLTQMSADAF